MQPFPNRHPRAQASRSARHKETPGSSGAGGLGPFEPGRVGPQDHQARRGGAIACRWQSETDSPGRSVIAGTSGRPTKALPEQLSGVDIPQGIATFLRKFRLLQRLNSVAQMNSLVLVAAAAVVMFSSAVGTAVIMKKDCPSVCRCLYTSEYPDPDDPSSIPPDGVEWEDGEFIEGLSGCCVKGECVGFQCLTDQASRRFKLTSAGTAMTLTGTGMMNFSHGPLASGVWSPWMYDGTLMDCGKLDHTLFLMDIDGSIKMSVLATHKCDKCHDEV